MHPPAPRPTRSTSRAPGAWPLHARTAALAALAALALPACIVERTPSARPGTVGPLSAPATPLPTPPGTAVPGTPAADAPPTSTAGGERATFSILPLGLLPYDGLTLPLISPAGRFFATQTGQAPPWDVVLSQTGAVPWLGSTVEVFERIDPAPSPDQRAGSGGGNPADARRAGLRRLSADAWGDAWGDGLPAGLLLGRSADATGFLVERPRADGSRAIGRVMWPRVDAAGEQPGDAGRPFAALEWLLDDGACNTDAVLVTDDVLLVARRAATADAPHERQGQAPPNHPDAFVLARFTRHGGPPTERGLPGKSLRFPLVSADRRYAVCMAVDPAGTEPVEAVVLAIDHTEMPILARLPAGAGASLGDAYQAAASTQALPRPADRSELAWLSAADGGLVRLDMAAATRPVREAGLLAALPIDGARDLVATGAGLRQRLRAARTAERAGGPVPDGVTVMAGPGLPREAGAPGAFVVLGAQGPGGGALRVDVLVFGK